MKKQLIKPVIGFFVGIAINAWIFYPIDFISNTSEAAGFRVIMAFVCIICAVMVSLLGADL